MIKQRDYKRIPLGNIDKNITKPKNAIIFFDQPIKNRNRYMNSKLSMNGVNGDYELAMKRSSLGVRSSSLFNVSIYEKTRYKGIKSINKIKKVTPTLGQSRLFELNDLVNIQNREEVSKPLKKTSKKMRIRVVTQNHVQKDFIIPKIFPKVSVTGFKII